MRQAKKWLKRPIENEFAGAQLGDLRLSDRLETIASAVAAQPGVGFPQIFSSDAATEAFYRFVGNDRVTMDAVLEPHVQSSLERARLLKEVIVVHDTTIFTFGGDTKRNGLGHTASKKQGFLGHFALAVAPDEARTPLGVLEVETIVRKPHKKSPSGKRRKTDKDYEFHRWFNAIDRVEELADDDFDVVHTADREADFYPLLDHLIGNRHRFVIRAARSRKAAAEDDDDWTPLNELVSELEPQCTRTVELSPRGPGLNPTMAKIHPSRKGREAELAIAGMRVQFRSPDHKDRLLDLNVVRVWEPNPPRSEEPIQWILMTSEPIADEADLNAIVEIYRTRWVIEEFFKALKTGCSFEKRQLESFKSLSAALAIFIPVAWRLLLVRSVARQAPSTPAHAVIEPLLLSVLAHNLGRGRTQLTVEEALYGIAKYGGHLKRNGPPGWLTLGRGYERLVQQAVGWQAAMKAMGHL